LGGVVIAWIVTALCQQPTGARTKKGQIKDLPFPESID